MSERAVSSGSLAVLIAAQIQALEQVSGNRSVVTALEGLTRHPFPSERQDPLSSAS